MYPAGINGGMLSAGKSSGAPSALRAARRARSRSIPARSRSLHRLGFGLVDRRYQEMGGRHNLIATVGQSVGGIQGLPEDIAAARSKVSPRAGSRWEQLPAIDRGQGAPNRSVEFRQGR